MADPLELRALVQRFIRRFGLLAADSTPCGHPLPTSHAHALMILAGGSRTQRELAAELGLDKSNVSRLVARLSRSGHVAVTPGPRDRRERHLSLTARGEKLSRAIDTASRERFTRLLAGVPARRREALLGTLGELVHALENLEEPS